MLPVFSLLAWGFKNLLREIYSIYQHNQFEFSLFISFHLHTDGESNYIKHIFQTKYYRISIACTLQDQENDTCTQRWRPLRTDQKALIYI